MIGKNSIIFRTFSGSAPRTPPPLTPTANARAAPSPPLSSPVPPKLSNLSRKHDPNWTPTEFCLDLVRTKGMKLCQNATFVLRNYSKFFITVIFGVFLLTSCCNRLGRICVHLADAKRNQERSSCLASF